MSSDEESSRQNREKFTAERLDTVNACHGNESGFFFGPALPPHLVKNKNESTEKKLYGPVLPEHLRENEGERQAGDCYGPQFPLQTEKQIMIGPSVPSSLESHEEEKVQSKTDSCESNDDEDLVGPSPILMSKNDPTSSYKFVERPKLTEQEFRQSIKRESWMVELPEEKSAKFGLGNRQFRTRIQTNKETDRSVWTDTPSDKMKKKNTTDMKDDSEILKLERIKERDKEMEALAKKAAKKLRKEESLMEIHIKKMKKKAKKEAKKQKKEGKLVPERRPFDRTIDLQVHRFDETQKRNILNKARFLNDRFASGESKFL